MHIYRPTHTAPLMSFCFTEERSVVIEGASIWNLIQKMDWDSGCKPPRKGSGRLLGLWDLPTGLGPAMLRGERSCPWKPGTADDEQEEKANPEAAVRRVESFRGQKRVVRKACEPLSEVRECCSVHLPLSFPSLQYKWILYFDFRCGTTTDIILPAFQI